MSKYEEEPRVLAIGLTADELEAIETLLRTRGGHLTHVTEDISQFSQLFKAGESPYDLAFIGERFTSEEPHESPPVRVESWQGMKNSALPADVIFLLSSPQRRVEILQAGAFDCLQRPVNADELAIAANRALEHRRLKRAESVGLLLQEIVRASAVLINCRRHEAVVDFLTECVRLMGLKRARVYLSSDRPGCFVEAGGARKLNLADGLTMAGGFAADPRPRLYRKEGPGSPPAVIEDAEDEEASELVCVPLVASSNLVGILCADGRADRAHVRPDELRLLEPFAAQAAAALEAARPNEEFKGQVVRLETSHLPTGALTVLPNREALLRIIIEQAVSLLRASGGGIYEFHPERGELTVIIDCNRSQHVGRTIDVKEGLAGWLVRSGEPFRIIDDYNAWPGRASTYEDRRPYGAVVGVLLKWRQGEILGVLYVDDRVGRKFTEEEAHRLCVFADQAAELLANAALADKEERRRRLELLPAAIKEMMSGLGRLSLDDMLTLVARCTTEILNAEVCGVHLVKQPGFLTLEASYGHKDKGFPKGKRLAIRTGPRAGLTGHIAYAGKLFNQHGDALVNHYAVRDRRSGRDHLPSGECYSLLAIPLKKLVNGEERIIGLLRVENKKGEDNRSQPSLKFEEVDEWILSIFADAVVAAIESARLVAELNERKEFLSRLVSNSPNGVVVLDREGRITLFNERAEHLLGYRSEEAVGRHVSLLHEDRFEYRRVMKELRRSAAGSLNDYHFVARSKGGDSIPVCLSAAWLYDFGGRRTGSVGYFEDLRTLQKTQQQLGILLRASMTLARAKDLDEGLGSFAELMASLLPHSFCRILLMSEDGERLDVKKVEAARLGVGSPSNLQLWQPIELSKWLGLKQILEKGAAQPLLRGKERALPVLEKLSRWLNCGAEIQSLLLIPLKLDKGVVGLLEFGDLLPESERPFTQEEIDIASAIAAKVAALIDIRRLHELTKRRRLLLEALHEASFHIHSTHGGPGKLLEEVVRLAAQLVGCKVGGLYVNQSHLEQLELRAIFGLSDHLKRSRVPQSEGVIGEVARTGEMRVVQNYSDSPIRDAVFDPFGLKFFVALPLKQDTGEVEAVLFVADASLSRLPDCDIKVLQEFAAQASVALQTSRLLTQAQQISNKLSTHIEISNYFQGVRDEYKMLHAVLTGMTADYGLRFNRAALFLLNEQQDLLDGQLAVGHITEEGALQDWRAEIEQQKVNFASYCERLEQMSLPPTPLNQRIAGLRLRLGEQPDGAFARAVESRKYLRVGAHEFDQLPARFREAFCPSSEIVVVPLVVGRRVLGLLAADNKFTRAPVSDDDINFLLTFSNTAAIAIDNHRLLVRTEYGLEKLRALFNASVALTSSDDAHAVLQDIVEKAPAAAEASWVRIILIDEFKRPWRQYTGGTSLHFELERAIRPEGISVNVMRTRHREVIEDTGRERERVNPFLIDHGIRAALCFPFGPRDEPVGVMWFNYDAPRHFQQFELDALELYVNQGAVAYEQACRVEELRRLHQSAKTISGAFVHAQDSQTVVQPVLRAIVDEAATLFDADQAAVWPYDQVREQFLPDKVATSASSQEKSAQPAGTRPPPLGVTYAIMERGSVAVMDTSVPDQPGGVLRERVRTRLLKNGVSSFQGMVLKAGGELLGALCLSYKHRHTPSTDELRLLENFAGYASLSLKNARLLERVRRANRAAEVVAHVTALGVNREAALDQIARGTKDAVGCDAVVLFAYDPKEDVWNLPPACAGVHQPEKAQSYSEIERGSLVYDIMEGDAPYEVIEDVTIEKRFKDRRFARDERIKSLVAIPLLVMQERVGVMFVNYRKHHRFTADDLSNIQLFANQAAVAVRNAQLYDERAERLCEQQALERLSKTLLGAVSMQETQERLNLPAAGGRGRFRGGARRRAVAPIDPCGGPERIQRLARRRVRDLEADDCLAALPDHARRSRSGRSRRGRSWRCGRGRLDVQLNCHALAHNPLRHRRRLRCGRDGWLRHGLSPCAHRGRGQTGECERRQQCEACGLGAAAARIRCEGRHRGSDCVTGRGAKCIHREDLVRGVARSGAAVRAAARLCLTVARGDYRPCVER